MIDLFYVLLALILFLVPGYLFLLLFRSHFDFVEMLCAASGLSIAVIPLILYLATYSGFTLTSTKIILFLIVGGGIFLWDGWQRYTTWQQGESSIKTEYILLGIIFLAALTARIWMVQDIHYPLWTDSYHHTIIAQLIVEAGQIPSSYEPYAPIDQFTYHFGFHALVAWFHWLSQAPIPRSVVLIGQVINALVVPTTYLLGKKLFQNSTIGLIAALVVGLVSHMPAFFINWGRYTQLAGQILLPVLIVLTWEALKQTQKTNWLLIGIAAMGLFLVHVRVALFYGVIAGLLFLFEFVPVWRQPAQIKQLLLNGLIMAGAALLVGSLWLSHFFSTFGVRVAQEVSSGYDPAKFGSYFAITWRDIFDNGMQFHFLLLALGGGIWGGIKRDKAVWLLILWMTVLFAVANLHLVGITSLFSTMIVIIWLYLPASLLIGYAVQQMIEIGQNYLKHHYPQSTYFSLKNGFIVTLLISLGGMIYIAGLFVPQTRFVWPADLEAMAWIQKNIPEQALFHIRTEFWVRDLVQGVDSGYWIPVLAHRETTVPPQPYLSDGSAEYARFINQRAYELEIASTVESFWQTLQKYQISHIYIGSRETKTNVDILLANPDYFKPIYAQDKVWIFQVVRSSN